jgi:FMN-dependent NADH-azoreductase
MSLLRVDASIRSEGSASRALADIVEDEWRRDFPQERIVRRDLGLQPLPATAWAAAVAAKSIPEDERSMEQQQAVALATQLADELIDADAIVFAVPLYNFGVSQHFKTWVDLVVTDPRMSAGTTSAIAGKPAVLATVRGGAYSAGTPREGWDHSTGWIRRILEDVWQVKLSVVEREFTLVGVNPALDQFTDMAAQMQADAELIAHEHGALLGR